MAQITFHYKGAGSLAYTVPIFQSILNPEEWANVRDAAIQILNKRRHLDAATILEKYDFQICKGENDFRDEFNVLYRNLTLEEFSNFQDAGKSNEYKQAFAQIAKVLTDLGHPVRFIGAEYVPNSATQPVASPNLKLTSATVQNALKDAEQMVAQKKPVSAVDRAHTALHGYLKQICADAKLTVEKTDPSLTDSVKSLIRQHPKFTNLGPQKDHLEKVFKGMSSICDALKRNQQKPYAR